MAEIVVSVAAKVAELLVGSIQQQLTYIFKYNSYLRNMNSLVQDLNNKREMVMFAVDRALMNGETIQQEVRSWLDHANGILERASEVMDINNYERENQRCCKDLSPNFKKRYHLGKLARRLSMEVAEVLTRGDFSTVSYPSVLLRKPSMHVRGFVDFESRRSILNDILNELRNPDVGVVGVYGMGGSGKTTLMKEVTRQAVTYKLFNAVIFVQVSPTPDMSRIQGLIADQMGLRFVEETLVARANKLHARLRKERKVLLILDDIWGSLDLEQMGLPVGNHKGCKLLLTSRSRDVLAQMDSQCIFCVDVLDEREAWSLFKRIAGDCVELPELQPIAIEVAKACGGLPVAIVTIAKSLRNKEEFQWRSALQELRRPTSRNFEGLALAHEAYKSIELSYQYLKSEELKLTFLLCGMMENESSIEDLLRYGMGFGLFPSTYTIEEALNRAASLVYDLKDSSLLLDIVDNKGFSMLDVVRDVARSIALRDRHIFTVRDDIVRWDWADEAIFKNCTAMHLHDIGVLPVELECPQLQFFYLKTKDPFLEVPDGFFKGMPRLRVLHMIGMGLLYLPSSLGLLRDLQTLCMDQCKLRDVAVIGKLWKLEILSFHGSDIEELPEEIGQLTGLKWLDLGHCTKLKVIPLHVFSRLTRLEVLYMGNTPVQWEVEGNKCLAQVMNLSHLTTLEIHIRDAKLMPKDLFSQTLERYKIVIGDDWGHWDRYKYETARTLKLSTIDVEQIWHNQLPAMGSFVENLTCLVVQGCGKLKYLFSSSIVNNFVQLQYLEICECTVLEGIIVAEEVTEEEKKDLIFPRLNYLKINDLESLTTFYSGSYIEFPLLMELKIENCPGLEDFIFNDKVEVPRLVKMIISCMDNLKMIWDNQLVDGSFCELRSLVVNDCQKLSTLFPPCICGRLSRLESLTVKSCGLAEQIFDLRELNFDEKYFTEATQLTELYIDHLPNLRHIWNEDPQGKLYFEKLQKVTVFLCPNLKNLFPASAASSLLKLDTLEVSDCGVEEIVAEGGRGEEAADRFLFPQLSSLQLHHLPELGTFYPGHTVEGPCLKRLGLHHCDKVKIFISECLSFYETNDIAMQQPFFVVKKDLLNMEELQLSGKAIKPITMQWQHQVPEHTFGLLQSLELNDDESTVFPLYIIQKFHSLEKLSLNCGAYKEIFSHGDVEDRLPQIKHLVLSELFDLKQIWKQDFKIYLNFQNLETLEVQSCFNLINIMPSSASFQNLKILKVWGCEGLINLVSSSTVKSLVQLEKLEVFDCKMMIDVLANEGAVTEEIVFSKLKSLSLMYLHNLTSFCSVKHILSFPNLESLVVSECPKMKIFSEGVTGTPRLRKVELNWKAIEQSREVDLNTTIQQNMEKRLAGIGESMDHTSFISEWSDYIM
ncbi:hypothetical protein ACOSQ4_006638 [Xanthoceras sorbifolium]